MLQKKCVLKPVIMYCFSCVKNDKNDCYYSNNEGRRHIKQKKSGEKGIFLSQLTVFGRLLFFWRVQIHPKKVQKI